MFLRKDFILNNVTMKEVLEKYGIQINRQMFCCPFHNDKTPSAKYYDNSFFCFTCGATGDLIQFVQDYFHIDFSIALEKINQDFGFNLPKYTNINKEELDKIKIKQMLQQEEKKKKRKQKINKLINICDISQHLEKEYKSIKAKINPYNWEETIEICSYIEQELELINEEFENLYIKSDF
jgi:hypothetical protein